MYKQEQSQFLKENVGYISGSLSGIVQVLIGQPFDTIKVRLQSSQNPNITMGGIVSKLLKNDGVKGFYKGTVAPLIGVSGIVSIQFGVFEYAKSLFRAKNGLAENAQLKPWELSVSGAVACIAASVLTIPIEHIRIRMQLQTPTKIKYVSTMDCFSSIFSQYGVKGLYKGMTPGLYRESLMGLQYGLYETFKSQFQTDDESKKLAVICGSAATAGIISWGIMFPFDSLKSKMQGDSLRNPKFRSMFHILRQTSLKSLYSGIAPCLMRAVPVNCGGFIVYEQSKKSILNAISQKQH